MMSFRGADQFEVSPPTGRPGPQVKRASVMRGKRAEMKPSERRRILRENAHYDRLDWSFAK